MSDTYNKAASSDEDDFFSARGSNDLSRNQHENHSIWEDESTNNDPTYTAFQSLPSGVEHEVWSGEAGDEDASDLVGVGQEIDPAVARIEDLEGLILSIEEGAPIPAYPTVISDEADVLRAEENPWDAESVISRFTAEPPLQEPINAVRPRATTDGVAQPEDGAQHPNISFDTTVFNNRPRLYEGGTATVANTQDDIHSSRAQKNNKKKRKNGKPSSKQEDREDHSRPQGHSSRAVKAPRTHLSGRNRIDLTRRRNTIPPQPTMSRSRNTGRVRTSSTVCCGCGRSSARLNVTYGRTPRIDSNESHLYKGFCWGWKPSWWPKAWWWPHTTR